MKKKNEIYFPANPCVRRCVQSVYYWEKTNSARDARDVTNHLKNI